MRIAIIGGGLAGTSCAYVLKQAGHEPVIYEAASALAAGASGNEVGLYNPRFTAEYGVEAQFYDAAFHAALGVFEGLSDIGWNPCGALHLINDEKKAVRFPKTVQSWGWGEDAVRMVSAAEASALAGVEIDKDALYLARSGMVSPKALCAAYAKDVEIHTYTSVPSVDAVEADAIVLACGAAVSEFIPWLELSTVRGQVSMVKATEQSARVKAAICYGGYMSPAQEGVHMVGSSFQRWLDHTDILDQDDADNLDKMAANIPTLAQGYEICGHRAALRTTAKDHFPVIGECGAGVYVTTAHGSHGILSSLMGAQILAAEIDGSARPVGEGVMRALLPQRFLGAD